MLSHNIDIMRAKDVARAMQQGMQQGEFEMLKRLISKRFGTLTASQEQMFNL